MALKEIYRHPVEQVYRAPMWSKAFFFQVITLLLTIVCPLLVTFRSQGFWLKTGTYVEQPRVTFTHQFIFLLRTRSASRYFVWSSFAALNRMEEGRLAVPLVRTREEDRDGDGKPDALHLTADFPLPRDAAADVVAVQAILFFDYQLDLYSRLRKTGLVSVSEESQVPSRELSVSADLELEQRVPLRWRGVDLRFLEHPVNLTEADGTPRVATADDFRLRNLVLEYGQRNLTLKLVRKQTFWEASGGAWSSLRLGLRVGFPAQELRYSRGLWELLKWAWVQYAAVLPIFLLAFGAVRRLAFQNRLLQAYPVRLRINEED